MKKILIQKITQNNWNFWTVNLIMQKKMFSSRQIFRYAVPARTVTKKHCIWLSSAYVCHKPVLSLLCQNGWTDRAGFWHIGFLRPFLHRFVRKFGYLQNGGNSLWNFDNGGRWVTTEGRVWGSASRGFICDSWYLYVSGWNSVSDSCMHYITETRVDEHLDVAIGEGDVKRSWLGRVVSMLRF